MTTSLWPWLALAGAGALHGLNPCGGWALMAWRPGAARAALPALAAGHFGAVGMVAAVVAFEPSAAGLPLKAGALALGLALVVRAWRRRAGGGLALASFAAAAASGSGTMLVPALVPLCLGDSPAREITAAGSWPLALAAVFVHAAAMLAVTAALAFAARRAFRAFVPAPPPHR